MAEKRSNWPVTISIAVVGLVLTALLLVSCNTIVGAGEDISSVGYALGANK